MEKRKFQLNDLKKENILKVPEGYFDDLPMRIQSRIEQPKSIWEHSTLSFSLKYALPEFEIQMLLRISMIINTIITVKIIADMIMMVFLC